MLILAEPSTEFNVTGKEDSDFCVDVGECPCPFFVSDDGDAMDFCVDVGECPRPFFVSDDGDAMDFDFCFDEEI